MYLSGGGDLYMGIKTTRYPAGSGVLVMVYSRVLYSMVCS